LKIRCHNSNFQGKRIDVKKKTLKIRVMTSNFQGKSTYGGTQSTPEDKGLGSEKGGQRSDHI